MLSVSRFSLLRNMITHLIPIILGLGIVHGEFHHPGIPFNKDDLKRMKEKKRHTPWKAAYKKLENDRRSSLDYKMKGPFEFVNREPNENLGEYIDDSTAVLHQSILYSVTGKEQYAENALKIIRAWTKEHTKWGGGTVFLAASDHGLYFIQGAEILRYTYKGWTENDTKQMETYCIDMLWPLFHFPKPLRAANQGAAQLKGGMAVAVFCNDKERFVQVIDAFRADPSAGILNTLENGQTGDSGRDQGHAFGMLKNLTFTAEVAHRQDVDLYSLLDNRLLKISEYWSKYNLGEEVVPWVPYGTAYGFYPTIGAKGRKSNVGYATGYLETVYAAYTVRRNLKAPFLKKMRDAQEPNIDTFLYRKDKDSSVAKATVYLRRDHTRAIDFKPKSRTLGSVSRGAGKFDSQTEVWSLSGAGDVYGGRDSDTGYFKLQEMTKDATIVTRITSIEDIGRHSKAGIIFRRELDASSDMLAVFGNANEEGEATWRGGNTRGKAQKFSDVTFPLWLKIEKKGPRVNGYVSPDGKHWTPISSCTFEPSKKYYLGLSSAGGHTNSL